ncbi:MAG: spermidine synthase [Bacteriovorax sp.]
MQFIHFSNTHLFLFLFPIGGYYLLYGIFISSLWKEFDALKIRKIYSIGLLFSALGLIASCFFISIFTFKIYLIIPLALFLMADYLSSMKENPLKRSHFFINLTIICILFIGLTDWRFNPNFKLSTASSPSLSNPFKLIDQQLSQEAMLSLVQLDNGNAFNIQLDNGSGTVSIPSFSPKKEITKWPQIFSTYNPNIQNVLVLMAGAGGDAYKIKQIIPNAIVDNVEINEKYKDLIYKNLPEAGRYIYEDQRSKFFFEDARIFLEENKKKYDSIIFSFHGSPIVNFLGISSHYNDYLYTIESFRKAILSLTPDGSLLVLSGNKVQILTTLHKIVGDRLKENIVILEVDPLINRIYWRAKHDKTTLLFKKSPFSKSDLDRISKLANYAGYKIIYSPFQNKLSSNAFSDLLNSSNFDENLKNLSGKLKYFKPIYDDSPFFFKSDEDKKISNIDYWKDAIDSFLSFKFSNIMQKNSLQIFLILAVPLSFLFYFAINIRRTKFFKRDFSFFLACLFIGLGHTLLQTTITTTYRLFFGGTTMPLLMCSSFILIGLSIGAFFLDEMLKYFKSILLLSLVFCACLYLVQIYPQFVWNNYKLAAPLFTVTIILFFSFIGTFFPYVFTRMKLENSNCSSFALVWDTLSSLIVFFFFNDLLLVFGNRFLFIASIIFYMVALLLTLVIRIPKAA